METPEQIKSVASCQSRMTKSFNRLVKVHQQAVESIKDQKFALGQYDALIKQLMADGVVTKEYVAKYIFNKAHNKQLRLKQEAKHIDENEAPNRMYL